MARIEPIPIDQADGKARALLHELAQRGGEPGPMVRAMANAPTLLRGYLELTRAMKRTHLDRRIVERINLAVHEWLSCDYCLVAHTRAARQLGVPESEIKLARQGTSSDPATAAIVAFAQQVASGVAWMSAIRAVTNRSWCDMSRAVRVAQTHTRRFLNAHARGAVHRCRPAAGRAARVRDRRVGRAA